MRVHFCCRRGEEQIDAFGFEQSAVGLEGSWVFVKILVGTELCGVDEDGSGDDMAGGACRVDEGKMALVQGTHRGDEAYGHLGRASGLAAGDAHRRDSAQDLHATTSAIPSEAKASATSRGRW